MIQEKAIPLETTETLLARLMKNYTSYNLWANTTLTNWLLSKETTLLEQHVPSSFPSIKLTLVHIWQTQHYWISIIKKREPEIIMNFDGSVEDAIRLLLESSQELVSYIEGLSDEDIQENIEIVSPWFQCNLQNFEYIQHCMNHSTYHRGQITSIGRNLGFTDAPMTDYNFYNVGKSMGTI